MKRFTNILFVSVFLALGLVGSIFFTIWWETRDTSTDNSVFKVATCNKKLLGVKNRTHEFSTLWLTEEYSVEFLACFEVASMSNNSSVIRGLAKDQQGNYHVVTTQGKTVELYIPAKNTSKRNARLEADIIAQNSAIDEAALGTYVPKSRRFYLEP